MSRYTIYGSSNPQVDQLTNEVDDGDEDKIGNYDPKADAGQCLEDANLDEEMGKVRKEDLQKAELASSESDAPEDYCVVPVKKRKRPIEEKHADRPLGATRSSRYRGDAARGSGRTLADTHSVSVSEANLLLGRMRKENERRARQVYERGEQAKKRGEEGGSGRGDQ